MPWGRNTTLIAWEYTLGSQYPLRVINYTESVAFANQAVRDNMGIEHVSRVAVK